MNTTHIKETLVQRLSDGFGKDVENQLTTYWDSRITELRDFVANYETHYLNLLNSIDVKEGYLGLLSKFKSDLYQSVNANPIGMLSDYETIKKWLEEECNKQIEELDAQLVRTESLSKYPIQDADSIRIKLNKHRKNLIYSSRIRSISFSNFFRQLFKKSLKSQELSKDRVILLKELFLLKIESNLYQLNNTCINDFQLKKSEVLNELWNFDTNNDNNLTVNLAGNTEDTLLTSLQSEKSKEFFVKIFTEIDNYQVRLTTQIKDYIQTAFVQMDKAMVYADTPDLSNSSMKLKSLVSEKKRYLITTDKTIEKWQNTHSTLLDDWAIDIEVAQLYYDILNLYEELNLKIDHIINSNLNLDFEDVRNFILSSVNKISTGSKSSKSADRILKQEKQLIKTEIADAILPKINTNLSLGFNDDLKTFSNKVNDLVGKVSERRAFIKNRNYNVASSSGDINWISPQELISFEALPEFQDQINQITLVVKSTMEKAQLKLLSIGTVSDFSLESALLLNDESRTKYKEAVKTATAGYERAKGHLIEAEELIATISEIPVKNLQKAIHDFNTAIQKLKNNENLLDLNLQIVKAKAVEHSKKVRRKVITWFSNIIPLFISHLKLNYARTFEYLHVLRSKLGVAHEPTKISYELSEFINQTEESLKRLPFVYQRLYQLKPTDESRFFVNRTDELEALQVAFDDWRKGRFVTLAVTGEKGCGVTSFVSYFLKKIDTNLDVIHQTPASKIYEEEAYLRFFADLLGVKEFKGNDEIIIFLNEQEQKKIIVLENLQHMFLKRVNGFACQQSLFDLMTQTADMVFWIGTYTIHSWKFLEQTINISEHLVREVNLKQLNEKMLEEIVLKRNQLSGYKINFLPASRNETSRTFNKLTDQAKQEYLAKQFFNNLRQLSNGNVSLAQLYWLRYTDQISDDCISIKAIQELDLSLLKSVSQAYLFALHAILLHDGLSLEEYSIIFHQSDKSSLKILKPMLEKGILIKPKDKYNINPIIFRPIIQLLSKRNFIN